MSVELKCAQCEKPVRREGEKLLRSCDCAAPVIAAMTARMAGNGGLRKS